MADKFEIGEVAIYCRPGSQTHGKEVIVMSRLHRVRAFSDNGLICHGIVEAYTIDIPGESRIPTHGSWSAEPHELRKKPPKQRPREATGDWELCPWQPNAQTVLPVASFPEVK